MRRCFGGTLDHGHGASRSMSQAIAMTIPATEAGLFGTSSERRLALLAAFLTVLLWPSLVDPDYYWHLETGRYILNHGHLPSGDIFSFTRPGAKWVLHEWLFQAILYAAFAAGGSFGVKLLAASLVTATVWLVFATASRVSGQPRAAAVLTVVFFAVFVDSTFPRPQLATYLFLAAYFYILLSFKYFRDDRFLPAMPAVMIAWVNLHGAYLIGIAFVVLFCVVEWIGLAIRPARADDWQRLRRLSAIAGLVVLASLVNPEFVHIWTYPFEVMGLTATQFITEWASPSFNRDHYAQIYLLLVAGFVALQIYRKTRPDLTELAVPGFFIFAGFVSIRHIPPALVAMTAFAAVALRDGLAINERLWALLNSVGDRWRKSSLRGKPVSAQGPLLNLSISGAFILLAAAVYPVMQTYQKTLIQTILPADAAEFIRKSGISGHMFNAFVFGGYFINALPDRPVFIDGRPDMYGDALFKDYLAINNGLPNWAALIDKYQIDYVVCEPTAPIRQLLILRGDFRVVFEDKTSTVLVKNVPRFADVKPAGSVETTAQ
jgi:hypothetical protein